MKRKIITIIAVCALVTCLCTLVACNNTSSTFEDLVNNGSQTEDVNEAKEEKYYLEDDPMYGQDVLTMSKVTASQNNNKDKFGLFIYDAEAEKFVHAEDETTQFDNSKPIVIFTHGMGSGGIPGDDELCLYAAGYNVFLFKWAQYAEGSAGDTVNLTSKIWGVLEGSMCYENDDDEYIYNDNPSRGMAWQYVSYFNDFMKAHPDFEGGEIHLYGHSFGGMLTLATMGCMIWGARTNNYSREYLPDRVIMCDPYVTIVDNETVVDWTGETLKNGSIGIGTEILDEAKEEGISVALIRSSPWVLMLGSFWGSSDKDADQVKFDTMYPIFTGKTLHIDYETEWLETQMGMIDGINERHCISVEYYEQGFGMDYVYDTADPSGDAYGFAYNMPLAYFFTRVGTEYVQKFGADGSETEYDRSDDVQYSTGITTAKIAGFAFNDANDNGYNDDRLYNRVSGLKATLYKNGEAVSTVTTGLNGYYSFDVEDLSATYQVEVEAPTGYKLSSKTMNTGIANDDVNGFANGNRSANITLKNAYAVAILNVGLTK